MHKRFTLIAGIAALIAVAVPVSAAIAGETVTGPDGNTQSLEADDLAEGAVQEGRFARDALSVDVKTGATAGVPSPAIHDVIDFDQNLSLVTKGLPTCNAAALQNTSTEKAEEACGDAKIGTGSATTLLPLGTLYTEPTKVTAFNGVPQGGKPTVLLHAYGTSPLQTTLVLVGDGLQPRQGRLRAAPRRRRPADRRRQRRDHRLQGEDPAKAGPTRARR